MKAYIDFRIDSDGHVLSFDRYNRVPQEIRQQFEHVDTITHLMGWDVSAELLYSCTVDGCAIRDVLLERINPPLSVRCSLFKTNDTRAILGRLAFRSEAP